MRETRGECKTVGGKLVGVTIMWSDSREPYAARIDGDFFSHDDVLTVAVLTELRMTVIAALRRGRGDALGAADAVAALDAAVSAVMEPHSNEALIGVEPHSIAVAAARAYLAGIEGAMSADEGSAGPQNDGVKSHDVESAGADNDGATTFSAETTVARDARLVNNDGLQATCATPSAEPCVEQLHALRWRIATDPEPLDSALQMALDESLARAVADGRMGATLRFWRWKQRTVVLGAFQSVGSQVDMTAARDAGFTVVRRCTGGGTMLVEPDSTITWSMYVPCRAIDGFTVEQTNAACLAWIVEALRSWGIDARISGVNDIASPDGKIGGAASKMFRPRRAYPDPAHRDLQKARHQADGCLLFHVTMAYDFNPMLMARVLRVSAEKMRDKGVSSAVRRVDPLRRCLAARHDGTMTCDEASRGLESFAACHFSADGVTIEEDIWNEARAAANAKYATSMWTNRIG